MSRSLLLGARGLNRLLGGLVLLCSGCATQRAGPQTRPAGLSREEAEWRQLVERLTSEESEAALLSISFTVCHAADEKEKEKVTDVFFEGTQKNGTVEEYKKRVAKLLDNRDDVLRSYGAILLGLIGDRTYSAALADLLVRKPTDDPGAPEWERSLSGIDRRAAAISLGWLGASEYTDLLASKLRSSNRFEREGAAIALGHMRADRYAGDVAALLADENDYVQAAAASALAEMGQKQYAGRIAQLLQGYGDPAVAETAAWALARLRAREQVKDLAALLSNRFQCGYAAQTLAVLGAREYAPDILRLTDSPQELVRKDAALAIGILGEKQFAEQIAHLLKDSEEFVRQAAATAIVLMEAEEFAAAALTVLDLDKEKPNSQLLVPRDFRTVPHDDFQKLQARAAESLKRLRARNADGGRHPKCETGNRQDQ